jgi:nitroreductase
MTDEERRALVALANRAPSVHNIQPARFRFEDERTITLLEDTRRRLFVGDPEGKDNQKSLGAACEGLVLALSERGLGAECARVEGGGEVRPIAQVRVGSGGAPDPLAPFAATRASYRGAFAPRSDSDHAALTRVAGRCGDLHIIETPEAIADIARFFDQVSVEVLRAPDYRAELLSWMRLSPQHPDYARDGLNAAHMALSPIEAMGAGVVLGATAFPLLDRIGLAGPLIAESGKVKSAAAVALLHRPADESEFETGRRFYRIWLEIEREGLALCPMSVLADTPHAAVRLSREAGLEGRKLVTVFRIGRRPPNAPRPSRARLPAAELVVS